MRVRRFAMVVDTRQCVSCKACVLACKAENAVPDGFSRDWLVEDVRGRFPDLWMQNRSEKCGPEWAVLRIRKEPIREEKTIRVHPKRMPIRIAPATPPPIKISQ